MAHLSLSWTVLCHNPVSVTHWLGDLKQISHSTASTVSSLKWNNKSVCTGKVLEDDMRVLSLKCVRDNHSPQQGIMKMTTKYLEQKTQHQTSSCFPNCGWTGTLKPSARGKRLSVCVTVSLVISFLLWSGGTRFQTFNEMLQFMLLGRSQTNTQDNTDFKYVAP